MILQEGAAIAFSEAQRNGEPDKEKKKYPGGPFDPLGFSKNQAVRICWQAGTAGKAGLHDQRADLYVWAAAI